MEKKEYNKKLKQMEYLDDAMTEMEHLMHSFSHLQKIWLKDSDNELDLNDYLTTLYPFSKSLDEVTIDVALWYADGCSKMVQAKKQIKSEVIGIKSYDELQEPAVEYLQTLNLRVEYRSEDSWFFNIDKISIELSDKLKFILMDAQNECKKHKEWWGIEVYCSDSVYYLDENDKEESEWRTGAEYFMVRSGYITFHTENKYNPQCIFESESINL
jgi:hypothetical protein